MCLSVDGDVGVDVYMDVHAYVDVYVDVCVYGDVNENVMGGSWICMLMWMLM